MSQQHKHFFTKSPKLSTAKRELNIIKLSEVTIRVLLAEAASCRRSPRGRSRMNYIVRNKLSRSGHAFGLDISRMTFIAFEEFCEELNKLIMSDCHRRSFSLFSSFFLFSFFL